MAGYLRFASVLVVVRKECPCMEASARNHGPHFRPHHRNVVAPYLAPHHRNVVAPYLAPHHRNVVDP